MADDPYIVDPHTHAMMRRSTVEHRARERAEVAAAAAVDQDWIVGEPPESRAVTISGVPGLDLVARDGPIPVIDPGTEATDSGIVSDFLGKVDEALEYVTANYATVMVDGDGERWWIVPENKNGYDNDVADVAAFLVERAGVADEKATKLAEELLDLLST